MTHPLSNRDFRWLLTSRVLGNLGLGFAEVPLMWWVLEKTGQASLVATVALIGALGALVAAPLGGVWADAGNKKLQISLTLLADVLVQGSLIWGVASGSLTLWGVYVLVGLSALFSNLRSPALGALLPLLLKEEQYQQGNAAMSLVGTVGMAASFAAGGAVTGWLGVSEALLVGLVMIVLSILTLLPMREPKPVRTKRFVQSARAFAEGLGFVWRTPAVFWLIGMAMLLNLILAPIGPLMAPFAKLLGGAATQYGLLSTGFLVGELLGLILLNFIRVRNMFLTWLAGTWVLGGTVALLALVPTLGLALLLLALFGVAASFMNVQAATLLQLVIPKEMMGRVSGVLQGLNMGIQPLGLGASSGLVGWLGIRNLFGAMGLLLMLASLAFLQRPVRAALSGPKQRSASNPAAAGGST
jgi:MFS family permease